MTPRDDRAEPDSGLHIYISAAEALKAQGERVRQLIEALEHARLPIAGGGADTQAYADLTTRIGQLDHLINYSIGCGVPPALLTPLVELEGDLVQLTKGGVSPGLRPLGAARKMAPVVADAKLAYASAAVTLFMKTGTPERDACRMVATRLRSVLKSAPGALKSYRKKVGASRDRRFEEARKHYDAALEAVGALGPRDGADTIVDALLAHRPA